jgi:hypothetical protein
MTFECISFLSWNPSITLSYIHNFYSLLSNRNTYAICKLASLDFFPLTICLKLDLKEKLAVQSMLFLEVHKISVSKPGKKSLYVFYCSIESERRNTLLVQRLCILCNREAIVKIKINLPCSLNKQWSCHWDIFSSSIIPLPAKILKITIRSRRVSRDGFCSYRILFQNNLLIKKYLLDVSSY